ncbi:MAG: 4Fe-4S binding protein [Deltaproteobacteria bacterium]|nr:4Fe-4S binding protein [Deltaproteobacteria bacterium]
MWTRRRRAVALLGGAATLLLPFLRIGGDSAFRFDIPTMRLLFFGSVLWIDQFHLVLLLVLFLLLLAVGTTAVFGRVWCGWLCPQTVIAEVARWMASALPGRARKSGASVVLVPLSALVSLSLLWFFVPPAETFRNLFRSPVLLGFFLAQWGVVYGMVGVLGTRFCGTACPYGMLQNAVADGMTISVAFDPGRADCLRCNLCARVCPVGIDIRKGDQRECLACATCIDACRGVTAARGIDPFISYRGTVRRARAYLFAGTAAAAGLAFLFAVWAQPSVAFAVQWEGSGPGGGGNLYRYSVRNGRAEPVRMRLSVDRPARILGDPGIAAAPKSRAFGSVAVTSDGETRGEVRFTAEGNGFRFVREAAYP